MRFFDYFKRIFNRSTLPIAGNGKSMPESLRRMLVQIEKTEEVELTCDEVLALLDQFAEAQLRGEDVKILLPMMQQHLDTCIDCREELEALLRILQGASG